MQLAYLQQLLGVGMEEQDNHVAVSWDCPEELGSAWPKGVVYCGVTVGWRGEVQTAPVPVFGSMES